MMGVLRAIVAVIATIFVLTLAFGEERSAYDADLPLPSNSFLNNDEGDLDADPNNSPFGENGELPSEMGAYEEPTEGLGFEPSGANDLPIDIPEPQGQKFSVNELPRTGGLPENSALSQEALTGESITAEGEVSEEAPDWFPSISENNLENVSPNISAAAADNAVSNISSNVKLSAEDMASYGILNNETGGFDNGVWAGVNRKKADHFLKQITSKPIKSTAMKKLIKRLLLTKATPPAGAASESWLATRVKTLHAMGEVDAANLLLVGAGANHVDLTDDSGIGEVWLENMLMVGQSEIACPKAQEQSIKQRDGFWNEALNVCLVLQGSNEGLRLRLDLIPEIEQEQHPFFYGLLKAHLNEKNEIPRIKPEQVLTPFEAILFKSLSRALTPNVVLLLPDNILRQVAMTPSLPMSTRLQAAEKLMNDFENRDDLALLSLLYDKVEFDEKTVSSPLVAKFAEEEVDGSKARALLWQAAQRSGLPSTRSMNLSLLWDRAIQDDLKGLASKLTPNLRNIAPSDNVAWFAPRVIRHGLRGDVPTVVSAWWNSLVNNRNLSREIVAERNEIAVLMSISSGELDAQVLDAWWRTLSLEGEQDYKRVERTLSILEASEIEVPSELWQQLQVAVNDAYVSQEKGPGGLWLRVLGSALETRHVAEVLIVLAQPLLHSGVEGMPSQTQSNMVTALRFLGLEKDANAIAYEAVIDLVENEPGTF